MELGTWCSFTGFGERATHWVFPLASYIHPYCAPGNTRGYPCSKASCSSPCSCRDSQGEKATHKAMHIATLVPRPAVHHLAHVSECMECSNTHSNTSLLEACQLKPTALTAVSPLVYYFHTLCHMSETLQC